MGLVKTRRLAAMHPPSPAASTFAEAMVDESEDWEAAAREGGDWKCCPCGTKDLGHWTLDSHVKVPGCSHAGQMV